MNHRWYVPTYTLFCLLFADGRGEYSLDKYFSEWISFYPFPLSDPPSIFLSGFARKLITTFAVSTLFLAGITKLLNSGIKWMDGNALQYHAQCIDKPTHILPLKRFIQNQTHFACFLAVLALVFELATVIAVIDHRLSFPVFILAATFHLGIFLVLIPNYFPQTVSYIPCVDWYLVFTCFQSWWHSDSLPSLPFLNEYVHESSYAGSLALQFGVTEASLFTATMIFFSHFASWLCIFLVFCCFIKVELWPFTAMPMYSLYRSKGASRFHIRNMEELIYEVTTYMELAYPFTIGWGSPWLKVVLSNPASTELHADKQTTIARPRDSFSNSKDTAHAVDLHYFNSSESLDVISHLRSVATKKSIPFERWNHYLYSFIARDFTLKFNVGKLENLQDKTKYPAREYLFFIREILHSISDVTWPSWVSEKSELSIICNFPRNKASFASVSWY